MIYRLGVLLAIATYISTASALPPCTCTRELKPVCGSDGQTYNNMCLLNCKQHTDAGLQLRSYGNCRSERAVGAEPATCICTLDYTPVCGDDGQTYPNKCALKCQRSDVGIAYNGECRPKRDAEYEVPDCFCTLDYTPVCGEDGHTYPNKCALECQRSDVAVAYNGECRAKRESVQVAALPPCVCTRVGKPVCGTDGKTYANPCYLNCLRETNEDLHILHPGPCRDDGSYPGAPQQSCSCSRDLKPLCASDGVTYNNECLMQCAGSDLTVVKDGPC